VNELDCITNELIGFYLSCRNDSYLNCDTISVGLSMLHSFVWLHHTYIRVLLLAVRNNTPAVLEQL
jgi:hypothetical protein